MCHDDLSTRIRQCIERLRTGDQSPCDDLRIHEFDRLVRLTRKEGPR